jgi:hypothetical protein
MVDKTEQSGRTPNPDEKPEICYCSALPKGSGPCLPCYTRWLAGSPKTRFRPTISNIAVIAGTIIGIMFGFATAQAQIPHINIEETCRAAARAMVGLMGGSTTEQDRNACLDSEQRPESRSSRTKPTYSSADKRRCMRTKRLSPELCGMAHLPRDGKGCEKDAAGRATYNGWYDASKGTPGHQLLCRVG